VPLLSVPLLEDDELDDSSVVLLLDEELVDSEDIVVSEELLDDELVESEPLLVVSVSVSLSVSVSVALESVVLVVGNTSSVPPVVGASVSMKNGFSSMQPASKASTAMMERRTIRTSPAPPRS
jgi:hypothetical protein